MKNESSKLKFNNLYLYNFLILIIASSIFCSKIQQINRFPIDMKNGLPDLHDYSLNSNNQITDILKNYEKYNTDMLSVNNNNNQNNYGNLMEQSYQNTKYLKSFNNVYLKENNNNPANQASNNINQLNSFDYSTANNEDHIYHNNTSSNSNNGIKEEIILVPTPIHQDKFNELKNKKNKQIIDEPRFLESLNLNNSISNTAMIDVEHSSIINEILKNNSTAYSKAFEDIVNSKEDDKNKIENFIKLQEKDYDQYFKALNAMEYQKVFNSLNNNDINNVYDKMINAESNINYSDFLKVSGNENDDFSKVLSNDYNKNKINTMQTSYNQAIENQLNGKNMGEFMNGIKADNYANSKFDSLFNKKFTDKEFEVEINKIMSGKEPNKVIEENSQNSFIEKSIKKVKKERTIKKDNKPEKGKNNLHELSKFREIEDNQGDYKVSSNEEKIGKNTETINLIDKGDVIEIISNLSNSSSNSQSKLISFNTIIKYFYIVNALISQSKKQIIQAKEKKREELINCKRNCDSSCSKVKKLKRKESEETCKLKCYLACSNNVLNKLLN